MFAVFVNAPGHRMRRLKRYAGHAVLKLATLTIGAAYVSPLGDTVRSRLDDRAGPPVFSGRAAVVAHLFYPELVDEILRCHRSLPAGSALLVTVPRDKLASVERRLAGVGDVAIVPVENRGRDIAPFIEVLNAGLLEGYDAVLKIHTKKSPHLRDGDIRRRLLFTALAGSRRRVAKVLALFEDPRTGLVGWRMAWRDSERFWMANRSRVEALASRMRLPVPESPTFFEGSMFWIRPAALKPLKDLRFRVDEFEPEEGQLDGTLHHALERMFDLAAAGEGYAARAIDGSRLR